MHAADERSENVAPPASSQSQAPDPAPPAQAAPAPGTAPPQGAWSGASRRVFDPRRKNPILACILSLMPGLGQVYVGYYKLGFIHMAIFAGTIAMLNAWLPGPLYPLLGIFLAFFLLYNIIDAGRRAAYYNQALDGVAGVEMPTEMGLPSPGGSLAGGVVLIIVGVVLLSNTALGFSLDWLEQWWPAAPILFGAYLVYRGVLERT